MTKHPLICAMVLGATIASAQAASPKEQYTAETKAAAARYAEDRKLCAEESDAARRLDCNRVAKAENTKALAAAKAAFQAADKNGKLPCLDCGKVVAVNVVEKAGESNAVGLLAGGAAGALLGNQVGSGNGRTLATIAGAAGGAYAGKKIQEKSNSHKVWAVHVEQDNGSKHSYNFDHDPGFKAGDRVKPAGQSIARQ